MLRKTSLFYLLYHFFQMARLLQATHLTPLQATFQVSELQKTIKAVFNADHSQEENIQKELIYFCIQLLICGMITKPITQRQFAVIHNIIKYCHVTCTHYTPLPLLPHTKVSFSPQSSVASLHQNGRHKGVNNFCRFTFK